MLHDQKELDLWVDQLVHHDQKDLDLYSRVEELLVGLFHLVIQMSCRSCHDDLKWDEQITGRQAKTGKIMIFTGQE